MTENLLALQHLLEVVAKLRSPDGGCPWDLAQTPESLIPYVIEEAYEVVDAIRSGDQAAIAEELGDLLLQVVLQAQIASESQQFAIAEVAEGIAQKLIRRHPHVFTDLKVQNLDEIHQNWEQIKAAEKGEYTLSTKLHRYARTLPPLMATMKILEKANNPINSDDIDRTWVELQRAIADHNQAQEKLGNMLFSLINLAQNHDLDPFAALQTSNQRFIDQLPTS